MFGIQVPQVLVPQNVPSAYAVVVVVVVVVAVVVVLTLSHGYNAVRGHRTGSNNSGTEDYLRRKG